MSRVRSNVKGGRISQVLLLFVARASSVALIIATICIPIAPAFAFEEVSVVAIDNGVDEESHDVSPEHLNSEVNEENGFSDTTHEDSSLVDSGNLLESFENKEGTDLSPSQNELSVPTAPESLESWEASMSLNVDEEHSGGLESGAGETEGESPVHSEELPNSHHGEETSSELSAPKALPSEDVETEASIPTTTVIERELLYEDVMEDTTTPEVYGETSHPTEGTVSTSTDTVIGDAEVGTTATNGAVLGTPTNTNENRFSFSVDECVSVGDGSYYCAKEEVSNESTNIREGVFAAPDAEGDMELYLTVAGKTVQLTDNAFDDKAPMYDNRSESVVWHRQIDGRYQIFSYDLETGEERQLTHDRFNNMEPSRDGDVTLWQAWIGDDWDIMMLSGDELTMLTDNAIPDVAPYKNDTYVTWQSFEDGRWKVKVYDTVVGTTETIGDADGGSVENPRFVLVYDTKFENGDTETKGYDLKNKETVPLSATPAPIPEEIPDPDQTGEERALVQTVVQVKGKSEEAQPEDDTSVDMDGAGSEGKDDPVDLVVSNPDTIASTSESVSSTYDLIIEESGVSEMSDVSHISEVIVPPFGELAGQMESQETIADSQ
jgi:hypothetical protein